MTNKPTYWFFWVLEHWGSGFSVSCEYYGNGWVRAFDKEAAAALVARGMYKEHGYPEEDVRKQVVVISEEDFKGDHTNNGYV